MCRLVPALRQFRCKTQDRGEVAPQRGHNGETLVDGASSWQPTCASAPKGQGEPSACNDSVLSKRGRKSSRFSWDRSNCSRANSFECGHRTSAKGTTMVLETVSWRKGSPSRAMAGRSRRSGKHAGGGRVFVVPSGQRQTRLALCVQHGDHQVEIKGGFVTYQSNI